MRRKKERTLTRLNIVLGHYGEVRFRCPGSAGACHSYCQIGFCSSHGSPRLVGLRFTITELD